MTTYNDLFPAGSWVVHTTTGRCGLIVHRAGIKYVVQFGACGPYESLFHDVLRTATKAECDYMDGRT